jgi:tetratricopeptide (TPR) repeat protein
MHLNWHRSVFMNAVIQGLGGRADLDRNGRITAEELQRFVVDKVGEYVRAEYPQQPGQSPTQAGRSAAADSLALVPAEGVLQYLSRGFQGLEAGEAKAAADAFSQALSREARFGLALFGRALANYRLDKHDEAINDCSGAIDVDPQNADAFHLRGELYTVSKKEQLALNDLENLIKRLAPNWAAPYQMRARLYREKKQFSEALEDLNKAIQLAPLDYTLFEDRGATLADKEDYKNAETDLRQAIALNPGWYVPYQDMSRLHNRQGNKTEADKWQQNSERVKAGQRPVQ